MCVFSPIKAKYLTDLAERDGMMLKACAFSSEQPKSKLEANFKSPVFKNLFSSLSVGIMSVHWVGCWC